ncbi:MAG TPA: helix-turn-helix transcriptional regulator [bacterium]|jgi:transcriptional regulator with XRE-family HTH domain|nr:helix-turn-helix transcriptional regulator [bacterium]
MLNVAKKRLQAKRAFVPDVTLWIAMNLLDKRLAAGLSQRQLAEKAGVSFRRLQSLETAETDNVTIKTLGALAQALGIKLKDLLKERTDYVRV